MAAFGWPWVRVTDSGERETNDPGVETRVILAKAQLEDDVMPRA
jgi:hypothetical protein